MRDQRKRSATRASEFAEKPAILSQVGLSFCLAGLNSKQVLPNNAVWGYGKVLTGIAFCRRIARAY